MHVAMHADFALNVFMCHVFSFPQLETCPPGYTGGNCSIIVNNCLPQKCQNGGTCVNAINNYTCTCAPGFTGRNCTTVINYCNPQPCTNGGTCVNGIGSFTCQCPPTYGGTDCSTRTLCPHLYLAMHINKSKQFSECTHLFWNQCDLCVEVHAHIYG